MKIGLAGQATIPGYHCQRQR